MIGYKGFDKNFKCKDFQYEVGQTYKFDGEVEICKRGFHFCDMPLAVFEFYPPADSRFALVEAVGNIVNDNGDKHKFCTDELKIIKELTLDELIAAVPKENVATNTGDYSTATTNTGYRSAATNTGECSAATNTGNCSAATNTGDRSTATNTGNCSTATNTGDFSVATNTGNFSAATNTGGFSAVTNTGNCSTATNTGRYSAATSTGDCSAATNTGRHSAATNTGRHSAAIVSGKSSVALVTGRDSKAKGAIGCWLVLGEWRGDELADVQVFKVDDVNIKADTYYKLKGGRAVEVEEQA